MRQWLNKWLMKFKPEKCIKQRKGVDTDQKVSTTSGETNKKNRTVEGTSQLTSCPACHQNIIIIFLSTPIFFFSNTWTVRALGRYVRRIFTLKLDYTAGLVSSPKEPHETAGKGPKQCKENDARPEWNTLRREDGSSRSANFKKKKDKGRHNDYIYIPKSPE